MALAALVFPHQLFLHHPALQNVENVFLIEDQLYFGNDEEYPLHMHAQKLILHHASMKAYAALLKDKGYTVHYVEADQAALPEVFQNLQKTGIDCLQVVDPVDDLLTKRLKKLSLDMGIPINWTSTPNFLNPRSVNQQFFAGRKRYFMQDFYLFQRKRLDILVDQEGKPEGGKWSFDMENRKKFPRKDLDRLPDWFENNSHETVQEARAYVKKSFPHALGEGEDFVYPVTRFQALEWVQHFLQERFAEFGPYEDAIVPGESVLFHSVLTPALNIGLITPDEVVEKAQKYAKEHQIPLAGLEGFLRQIIGWREFVRVSYEDLGVKMRNGNHWQHKRKMPKCFYDGTSGIEPVDDVIKRILKTGYCHHIERLMVLGGFFFLCEIDPQEIYRWFMEMFVDSYDWVMVPNVFAMSQNSCGGLITTKPYFSGSNYILKMSHFKKGEWSEIWDALYWCFIDKHAKDLKKNPRWSMMVRQLEKKGVDQMKAYHDRAQAFFSDL